MTCRECSSKKAIPGEVTCRTCLENRQIEYEASRTAREHSPTSRSVSSGNGSPHGDKPVIPKGYFGVLRVRMDEARGLLAGDTNILGKRTVSDPYCVLTLSVDHTRRATRVVSSTLNPVWNNTFEMPVRVPVQYLEIDVWDKDLSSSDDHIGKLVIPIDRLPNGHVLSGWVPVTYFTESESLIYLTGQVNAVPAGGIKLHIRLDYKMSSELRGYLRGAVFDPPPVTPKFDLNALYGPAMLAIELLWTRMLGPVVNAILYVLFWENFLLSLFAMVLFVPMALYIKYWPSAMCFALALVIVYNFFARMFRTLTNPIDAAIGGKGVINKIPGLKAFTSVGKGFVSATRLDLIPKLVMLPGKAIVRAAGGGSSGSNERKVTAAGDIEPPPDYQEQSLGTLVNTITNISPGWLKDMIASYQPTARTLADYAIIIYDIIHTTHRFSALVLLILIALGTTMLFVPYSYVLAVLGPLVIFLMSPLMSLLNGFISYLMRHRRYNDPAKLGFFSDFDPEWTSADAVQLMRRKSGKMKTTETLT